MNKEQRRIDFKQTLYDEEKLELLLIERQVFQFLWATIFCTPPLPPEVRQEAINLMNGAITNPPNWEMLSDPPEGLLDKLNGVCK